MTMMEGAVNIGRQTQPIRTLSRPSAFSISGQSDNMAAFRSMNYFDKKFRNRRDVKMMAHGMGTYGAIGELKVDTTEAPIKNDDNRAHLTSKGNGKF